MIKFSDLVPRRRDSSVSATGLASLVFALAVGCVSMSVLLRSGGDALAANECGAITKYSAESYTDPGASGVLRFPGVLNGVRTNILFGCGQGEGATDYQLGSETDDSGFPLTAKSDGTAPDTAPEGNVVYSLSDFVVVQTYTPTGANNAVNRPWWQAECVSDSGQMCWTTIPPGSDTSPPSGAEIYYRLVDTNGNVDRATDGSGDYFAGPAVNTYSGVLVKAEIPAESGDPYGRPIPAVIEPKTTVIAAEIPIPDSDTAQVATKRKVGNNLADAIHNRLFLKASELPDYPRVMYIHMGSKDGIVVRGIKERIYLNNGNPTRIPRTLVGGVDEDGFGRYAAKYDVSTDIGVRADWITFHFFAWANAANRNVHIEGGADKVSKIQNRQINTEGGSLDGGGIDFGGDAKDMFIQLGNLSFGNWVSRATVVARSKGDNSDFHAVYFHPETQRGGTANLAMVDTTIQMLNGDSSPAPGAARGLIVTTGNDSSGITISVANPVGDEDDGDSTGGIEVQVNTPVTIKTSGARSHGIVLNLGFGEGQKENTGLYQRAAVLMEASHRDTGLRVGMQEGTKQAPLNNLLATTVQKTGNIPGVPGYEPSVRIETNGNKSGGIVIRNSGAAGEGGARVRLGGLKVTFDDTGTSDNSRFPRDEGVASVEVNNSDDFASSLNLADYSLVVDRLIATTGAGSHGVVASIAESGITMVVDIENLDDDDDSNGVEQTISASGTGSLAFSGAGSMGKFTVNVRGHVTGGIATGSGCDTVTLSAGVSTGGINLGACQGDGMDRLISNAVVNGNIESGGNSRIRLTGGSLKGNLALGAGNDDVELGDGVSISGTVRLGDGDNHWRGGGSISGAFASGSGDDTVVLNRSYAVTTVDLGAGTNMLTSSQTKVLTSIASASAGASGEIAAEGTTIQLNRGGVSSGMTFGAGNDVARWVEAVNVVGTVVLGDGDDVVNGGRINGNIAGGAGNDEVTLRSGRVSMTGVETFNKLGTGILTVTSTGNTQTFASTLSGSTADAGDPITVNVNEGTLIVSGHLNLGSTGTLTVKKSASLAIDVGGIATQNDGSSVSHGRITAREVVMLAPQPQIELVSGTAAPSADEIAAVTVTRLITGKVARQAGGEAFVPDLVSGGSRVMPGTDDGPGEGTDDRTGDNSDDRPDNGPGDNTDDGPDSSPGDNADDGRDEGTNGGPVGGTRAATKDDSNSAIYAVGALAVLGWVLRKDDMGDSTLVDYDSGNMENSFAGVSGSQYHSDGAMRTWANYYSDSAVPVQGLAVGLEASVSSNGSLSFTAMPEAKGSLNLNSLSLNQKLSFQGGNYSMKGQWHSEDYFATAELSYADAASSTSFDNPAVGGKLGGKFDMTNSHLEVGAGARMRLTDNVSVTPAIGLYGGSVSQGESVLTGRSVVASMSKQELSYTGWNLGIRVRPDAWITGGTRFQPRFSLNTFRTSSKGHSVQLRQADKAGVLDFSNRLPIQGMPAVVNTFRAGLTMKSESGLNVLLDYVGMEIDGELQHGAIAKIQTRF